MNEQNPITNEDAMLLHEESILRYGGGVGVRDQAVLESAISRPFATWGGELLYKDPFEQAAATGERIIINHPLLMETSEPALH